MVAEEWGNLRSERGSIEAQENIIFGCIQQIELKVAQRFGLTLSDWLCILGLGGMYNPIFRLIS